MRHEEANTIVTVCNPMWISQGVSTKTKISPKYNLVHCAHRGTSWRHLCGDIMSGAAAKPDTLQRMYIIIHMEASEETDELCSQQTRLCQTPMQLSLQLIRIAALRGLVWAHLTPHRFATLFRDGRHQQDVWAVLQKEYYAHLWAENRGLTDRAWQALANLCFWPGAPLSRACYELACRATKQGGMDDCTFLHGSNNCITISAIPCSLKGQTTIAGGSR